MHFVDLLIFLLMIRTDFVLKAAPLAEITSKIPALE